MQPTAEQIHDGQALYTKGILSVYDILVLGLSNRFIWKCPSPTIWEHYNAHISSNHLDVGVGTGYFLDRCRFPSYPPRVALMDMNPNSLALAARRIVRYQPETYRQNIFEPISESMAAFDSVGINYLLHCLPGTITEKAAILDHLKAVMNPDACIFGSTILQGDVPRSWAARKLMAFYNRKGIFANTQDTLKGLDMALSQRFDKVSLKLVGCVALFSAQT